MTSAVDVTLALYQPADWCDVLIDEHGDARAHMEAVVARTWPTCPPHLRPGVVELLIRWREDMLAQGTASHGIVTTRTEAGDPVSWQVATSVVPLPSGAEVDHSQLLARYVRELGRDIVHVETYPTDMGHGLGLVAFPEVRPPSGLEALGAPPAGGPIRMAMAAALSFAPGSGFGVLVVGLAVAPGQVAELSALVAAMAGRSRLHLAGPADAEGFE